MQAREHKDNIVWRSHEVTRIEAFSDAVFAFAVTLLIVSLEVPKSLNELLASMRSFVPFAICFTILFQVWMTQHIFFRRFGLGDDTTLILNAMLLFTILFFVYPLKYLFNSIFFHELRVTKIGDEARLFYIYSGGYAAIFLLFTMMYSNALGFRNKLRLTPGEIFETRTNIYRNLLLASVGLLSVAMAAAGGFITQLAWLPYPLIAPLLSILHWRRGKIHSRKYESVELRPDLQPDTH